MSTWGRSGVARLYTMSDGTIHGTWRGGAMHDRTARRHRTNDVSTNIHAMRSWGCVVVVARAVAVIIVDGETPAIVGEHDGTMEVAVTHEAVPQAIAQEVAESCIACCHHGHVVIVVVTHCNIVQIVVHPPDVIIVNAVYLVDEVWVVDAEGKGHAVSQETCIVTHGCDAHALSIGGQCSNEEDDCGECSS
jgi:hypothetical protein